MTGLVSLVGAGPGDPELLTLKAVKRLEEADLVLYDALLDTGTLQFAARARRFFVGKRAGRPAIRQDAINRLMIREARRGHRIVRLKCGDPFVFGRGGEEDRGTAPFRHPRHAPRTGIRLRRRVGTRGIGIWSCAPFPGTRKRDDRGVDGTRQSRGDRQGARRCRLAGANARRRSGRRVAARRGRMARHARRLACRARP